MVHGFALLPYLLDAVQHPDMDFSVREVDAEKAAFFFFIPLLILHSFPNALLLFLLAVIFHFQQHIAVVFGPQVGGTHVPGASQVFVEKAQQVDIIAPRSGISDWVSVAEYDTDGRPIVVYLAGCRGKVF